MIQNMVQFTIIFFRTHTLPERPAAPRPRGDIEVLDEVMGPAAQAAALGIAAFGRQLMDQLVNIGQQVNNIQHYHLPIIPPVHQVRKASQKVKVKSSLVDITRYVSSVQWYNM